MTAGSEMCAGACPSAWEVWAELIVPAVGAAGSIAVAVVAVVVTARLAKADRNARELEVRARIGEAARKALESSRAKQAERERLIHDAVASARTTGDVTSEAVATWLPGAVGVVHQQYEWAAEVYHRWWGSPDDDDDAAAHAQPWLDIHDEQRDMAISDLQHWVRTGTFNPHPLAAREYEPLEDG